MENEDVNEGTGSREFVVRTTRMRTVGGDYVVCRSSEWWAAEQVMNKSKNYYVECYDVINGQKSLVCVVSHPEVK